MHYLLVLTPLLSLADATFIRKWNLGGCGSSTSMRCNRIPSGRCCATGRPTGGSVRIANMPSYVDLAVPYDGNRAADMMGNHQLGHCSRVRFSDTQFGDLNCLTRNNLGTGIWIACASRASARNCISMHSHPKRDVDGFSTLDLANFPDQGQPGYVDDEEAALH
ncbi:hypothetical protein CLAFUR0_03763 [Fulvia fulva]|nr:hypothetical protein CLAFUR0_03763 [Fulvia fulva]